MATFILDLPPFKSTRKSRLLDPKIQPSGYKNPPFCARRDRRVQGLDAFSIAAEEAV
jgi:hypothetical protein